MPVHASMLEVSELIYETCKTYLQTQGKFLLVLEIFIGAIIVSLIGAIGLFKPFVLRPLYVGWMIAAFPISWTMTKLILGILFYGLFTPLGVCFRILSRDALCLKLQPETDSYWIAKETPDDPRRYLQQF